MLYVDAVPDGESIRDKSRFDVVGRHLKTRQSYKKTSKRETKKKVKIVKEKEKDKNESRGFQLQGTSA